MIYRLRYCNKDGVEARVDIQKGLPTPVIEVEGTERPFILSYNNDKGNKSGMFLSSSADIEIYETPDFNIDNLKTSNETELSVTHYINNVISWQGFIIPDFFSIDVRNNPVIAMTASDRLGTLKNVTLSDLPSMISLRELAILCLNKTGLTLPLKTMADFNNGTGVNDFFNSKILTQRLSDTKGRNISCYDVLGSILTASNSFLTQRNGEWYIVNKYQHEIGSGKLYNTATTSTNWSEVIHDFSEITVGGRRTIVPVASSVGVYQEFGGGRIHPENYDFLQDLTGWNSVGGFVASIDNRKVDTFTTGGTGQAEYKPVYGAVTEKKYLVNFNEYSRNENPIYLESNAIPIFYSGSGSVTVSLDINAVGPAVSSIGPFPPAYLRVAIIATNGTKTKTLDYSGKFIDYPATNPPVFTTQFDKGEAISSTIYKALSKGMAVSGALEVEDDLSLYSLKIRIYGGGGGRTVLINSVGLTIKSGSKDNPKGIIYKSEQGSNFTKTHDLETSIFGDYLTNGLNGYFYDYPKDDTSSLFNNSGVLTNNWTTTTDTEQLPLLQHISRQKARMFSVAHDLLTAEIEVVNFDPLAIFRDCDGKRYSIVTAEVDFFNAKVNLDIEQIIYDGTISRRDFIYSYFGDGEKGVQSIGGISAGGSGGGTGGGLTPEQLEILSWWKKDPVNPNTIFTEMNAYSKLELSAYGDGSGDSSGGGVDLLQAWTDYDSAKDNWAVKAGLLVPFYNDTKSRLTSLEGGAALSLNVTGSGNAIASLTKSGTALTAVKGNFAELDVNGKILSSQLPSYVDDVLEYVNLAAFPATGETGKIYIAQDSNKTYRWSGTAYVEISASLALGETSSTAYRGDRGKTAYDHSQTEHQAIINGTGFVKANGKTLSYDNNSYSLSSHNHSGVYEPVLGNPAANGYLLSSTTAGARSWVAPYSLPTASASVLGGVKIGTNVSIASGVISVHNPVTIGTANGLSLSTQVLSLALATTAANGALSATDKTYIDLLKTFFEYDSTNNAIKALKSFYSTGEVSAYGIGSGGSGGGGSYDRLDAWVDYDSAKAEWVLSALLGNELNTRVGNLEGGSATTVNTTGTGNAVTSISKAGSVITANKDLTFSLSGHTHTISSITNLENTLNNKLETSIFNTHNNDNVRHITGAERTKWDGVVTDFDNLEIGGRNLIINTSSIEVKATTNTENTPPSERIYISNNFNFKANQSYTISLDLKAEEGLTILNYNYLLGTDGLGNTRIGDVHIVDNNEWGRYSLTVKFDVDRIGYLALAADSRNSGVGKGLDYYGRYFKIEKGTISTDWTPAPKDQVSDWNTTDVNSFSYIKNKPSTFTPSAHSHNASDINAGVLGIARIPTGTTSTTVALGNHTHSYLPLTGGTMSNTNLVTNLNADLLDGLDGTRYSFVLSGHNSDALSTYSRTGVYGTSDSNPDKPPVPGGTVYNHIYSGRFGSQIFGGLSTNRWYTRTSLNYTTGWGSWREFAFIDSNVASATKLQTSRTIWGQSFNGTGNVTGALSGATTIAASISVASPKVIFNAAGWSMEQVGSELQMKHNNVLKMRFTSTGSIVATEEITAYA